MSGQPKVLLGVVKQVMSGDTVIIRGFPQRGPPPEKHLCLSNIAAPKLAKKGAGSMVETFDEAFAWQSREFLRKAVLSQKVKVIIETDMPNGRAYGSLYLAKEGQAPINVAQMMVAEGMAVVRKESAKSQPDLVATELAARSAKNGMHADNASECVRSVTWTMDPIKQFVDQHKGKAMKAIIEHVRDGSTFRGFFLPSFQYFTLMLSGAKSPSFKLDTEGKVDLINSEKYAEEAKYFSESRLLQREVEVFVEDHNNTSIIGSVKHPNADVAEMLLREGFAKCQDRFIIKVTGGPGKLRAAEKAAKQKSLKVWDTYKPVKLLKRSEIVGTVIDVPYGDSLTVLLDNKAEMVLHLNNVRAPRPVEDAPRKTGPNMPPRNRNLYEIPMMFEARELLRELLIGQRIEATLEHKVDVTTENAGVKSEIKRNYCLVKVGNINVAEELVKNGLATVGRTRADDEGRTACYDDLLVAEAAAKQDLKGVHAKKESLVPMRVTEITGEKSKTYLSSFKRVGTIDAMVEHVYSGSRFRCYIPKENCVLTFLLSGINCPRNDKTSEIGAEAQKLSKTIVQLRKVQLEIETIDKKGSFIGYMHLGGKNIALRLLEEGFASVHFSAESSKHYPYLRAAEAKAKDKKLRLWEHDQEIVKETRKVEEVVLNRKMAPKKMRVSEVTKQGRLFGQFCSEGNDLEKLMEELREAFSTEKPAAYTPSRGQMCAAKFVDGAWYRALVEKIVKKEIHILYVDYGNREITTANKLALLPAKIGNRPRFAHEMALAFVKFPADEEDMLDSVSDLMSELTDKELSVNNEYRADQIDYVTIKNPENEDVAKHLIGQGVVLVDNKKERRFQSLIQEYLAAQEDAKKKHLNLWQYGDVTEDESYEFGMER